MKSAPDLSLEPRRSRVGAGLLSGMAVLSVVAILVSGLGAWSAIGVIAIVVVVAILFARRAGVLPTSYRLQPDGRWVLVDAVRSSTAELVAREDLGIVIVLHFRDDAARRIDLVLWPDSVDADTRRRLRAWLMRSAGTSIDVP
jgi:hypothetical protein